MRKTTVLALLILLLGVSGIAQAQDSDLVCGQLSEEDCQVLVQAQEALAGLSSYGATISGTFSISNLPDVSGGINISLAGTGSVSGDLSGIHMSQTEAMSLANDPQAAMDYISTLLEDISAETALTITLPEELVAQSGGQLPAAIPLELRLVDGIGYLNFDALRSALGAQGANLPQGWYGIDLRELFDMAVAMSEGMGTAGAQAVDPELMAQFNDPEFISRFVTVERLEDTTAADGTEVASFHTSINYQALMSDPAMADLMRQSMEEQGTTLTDEELDEMTSMMQQMFQGLTFDVFQTVGLEDHLPRSVQVTFNWNMQPMADAMIEAGEGEEMAFEGPAPSLSFNLVVNYESFDAVEEIVAPEGATVVPLQSLMGGMMGGDAMQAAPAEEDAEMTPTPAG